MIWGPCDLQATLLQLTTPKHELQGVANAMITKLTIYQVGSSCIIAAHLKYQESIKVSDCECQDAQQKWSTC